MELTIRAGVHPYTYTIESELRERQAHTRARTGSPRRDVQERPGRQTRHLAPRLAGALGLFS